MEGQGQLALGAEQKVYAEGCGLAGHGDLPAPLGDAGGEVTALVELTVVGQVALGDHAEDPAPVDDDGAVVEPPRPPQRRPHDQDREQLAAGHGDPGDAGLHCVQHGVLQEQLVQGIGRDPELGEHHHCGVCSIALGGEFQRSLHVEGGIGRLDPRHGRADPREPVAVETIERAMAHPDFPVSIEEGDVTPER